MVLVKAVPGIPLRRQLRLALVLVSGPLFFFSSRRRHTIFKCDWSSDVCSSDLGRPGDGSQNFSSNVLNLRNFGAQRTLVLFDGHRAAPSNADGTVDVDALPQMLVSRVDVVTGGASAVYGSDAVTGVINFVLDKKFEGLKFD